MQSDDPRAGGVGGALPLPRPAGVRETVDPGDLDALWTPRGSSTDATTDEAASAPQSLTRASAEARRAASLFLGGKDPAAIVLELRGVKSSDGGRRYQKALAEVLELIREGLRA